MYLLCITYRRTTYQCLRRRGTYKEKKNCNLTNSSGLYMNQSPPFYLYFFFIISLRLLQLYYYTLLYTATTKKAKQSEEEKKQKTNTQCFVLFEQSNFLFRKLNNFSYIFSSFVLFKNVPFFCSESYGYTDLDVYIALT